MVSSTMRPRCGNNNKIDDVSHCFCLETARVYIAWWRYQVLWVTKMGILVIEPHLPKRKMKLDHGKDMVCE